MRILIFLIAIAISTGVYAQKKKLVETMDEVAEYAIRDFDQAMTGPEGSLYVFGKENNIKGKYTFKVTLGDKSKVVSVFVVGKEGGDIRSQNILRDEVMDFKFSFKVPKGKNYKVEYKFEF